MFVHWSVWSAAEEQATPLTASTCTRRYSLLVDDKDKQDKKRPASAGSTPAGSEVKTFYYGGSPSSTAKNFTGCISYAYINR